MKNTAVGWNFNYIFIYSMILTKGSIWEDWNWVNIVEVTIFFIILALYQLFINCGVVWCTVLFRICIRFSTLKEKIPYSGKFSQVQIFAILPTMKPNVIFAI